MRKQGVVAILLMGFAPSLGLAQTTTGALRGQVWHDSGPIRDATVTLACEDAGRRLVALTREDGRFWFPAAPVGRCALTVEHPGFNTLTMDGVAIHLNATTGLGRVHLMAEPVRLDPIHVSANPVTVDPASTTAGENLPRGTFDALPMQRDYRSMLHLVAHANRSYLGDDVNVMGATGLENAFYLNGMDVTEPMFGAYGIDLPYNFVQEVQVQSGGYQAEHGGALGGLVNVLVRSGGKERHVDAFAFFTADALQGEPRIGEAGAFVEDFVEYDVGASVGGPIGDRLRYFAAYDADLKVNSTDLGTLGVHDDRRTRHRFASRLDWTMGSKADLAVTLVGDPTVHHTVRNPVPLFSMGNVANADPLLGLVRSGGYAGSAELWVRPSSTLLVNVLGGWSFHREDMDGDTERGREEPLLVDYTTGGTASGGYAIHQRRRGHRVSLRASATWLAGHHTVKGGVDLNATDVALDVDYGDPGLIQRLPGSYSVLVVKQQDMHLGNRIPAAFLQDSWAVSERLTLNGGVRWSGQYLVGEGGSVLQPLPGQWQPRAGLTYLLGESKDHKLFGSAGRYFQSLPLNGLFMGLVPWDNRVLLFSEDPRLPTSTPYLEQIWVRPDSAVISRTDGLAAEHSDEFTAGYEGLVLPSTRLRVRGIYRTLRVGLNSALAGDTLCCLLGNPGHGALDYLPEARRDYSALELSLTHRSRAGRAVVASYTLSRNFGNYPGLFDSDNRTPNPANYMGLQMAEQAPNSTGPLPNDRPHVLKLAGTTPVIGRLSLGAALSWASGAPQSMYAATRVYARWRHVVPRGSVGRRPSIWSADARLRYDFRVGRVVLDLHNIASRRTLLVANELRYQWDNGTLVENDAYGTPLVYQAPMSVRLGMELGF